MKNWFIIKLLFIIILTSCNSNEESTDDYPPIFTHRHPTKYYTNFNSKKCIQQIKEAKADISQGKFLYTDYHPHIPRFNEELEELLATHGIKYSPGFENCTLEQQCYAYYLDSIISLQKGEHFIRELKLDADSLFLSRWKTKRYQDWDLDEEPKFEGVDPAIYIIAEFTLPENWDSIPMKSKRQYIWVDVYIDNEGKLEKWEFYELYNLKDSNEKYLPYLQKEASRILSKMKQFSIGILNKKEVNCKMSLDISFDKREF